MKKRILSVMLTVALIVSLMCFPSLNVNASENTGYLLKEDFEGDTYLFSNVEVSDGVARLENSATATAVRALADVDVSSEFVFEFDMQCNNDEAEIYILLRDSDHKAEPYSSIYILPKSYEANKTYTYRFIINQAALVRSNNTENFAAIEYYSKELGSDQWVKGVYDKGGNIKDGYALDSKGNNIIYVKGTPAIRYLNNYAKDIPDKSIGFWVWSSTASEIIFDNVKVMAKESFVGSVHFEDASGEVAEDVPQDNVTPVFLVENYGGLTSVDAVTVVYDKNNCMTAYGIEKNIELNTGANEFKGATVDATDAADGGRVEAYIWTSAEDCVPVGSVYGILGTADITETSYTSAFIGESSENTKAYAFESIDRSMVANRIVIEGKHENGEKVPVSVKIEGKTSGDGLMYAQFHTADDGSFRKTFEINPNLCTEDNEALVTISGVDTTAVELEIPVFSNWEQMQNDFSAMNEDTAKEYFETYKGNLSFYESGKVDITEADTESLSNEDFKTFAFVKNHNEYTDNSYAGIAEASVRLINCLEEVGTFEEEFDAARNLEAETERIAKIREIIEGCSFMSFSTTGVANVDAICKVLSSSDAEGITEIYADFEKAYNEQKNAEEATVPGFTQGIYDGADLKKFFADNRTVLGVDPEKYSGADYDVMYVIYDEKNYDVLTTYTQVNEAIVFLDDYINEYNSFMAEIKNASAVAKDWEEIRTVLNAEYSYIEIELTDESAVVSKEYLYNRLIDMNCDSLWTVEDAFADAVEKQINYEIAAKDAYNTIMTETAVKAFFAEYGDMMEVAEKENMTDDQRKVFLEVYNRFALVATDYPETLVHLSALFEKLEKAEKLITDMNAEAESADWSGLKTIYEGKEYAEFVGADVSTPLINDIRALYLRIMEYAPFGCFDDARTAFEKAYSAQDAYEDVAGGYESFDEEEKYFDETAWNLSVSGNVVSVSGKVSANGERNIIIAVFDETNPMPIFYKQLLTDIRGGFETTFVLNPLLYNSDDKATLKIGGDGVNTYSFSTFDLYSESELETVVDTFLSISSKSEMKRFFEENDAVLGMSVKTDDDRVMESLFFLYNRERNNGAFDNIEDVMDVIKGADDEAGAEALMVQMEAMISCLEALNDAANVKNGSGVGRWSKIKTQVEIALDNEWIAPKVSGKISSESVLYGNMAGKTYNYMADVEDAYEKAWKDAAPKKENSGSGGSGGGITGGNSSNGGSGFVQSGSGASSATTDKTVIGGNTAESESEPATNLPEHPVDNFGDITSDFYWARTSIKGLRNYGLVKGDGNGMFRPADGIKREEFLKMLLDVFGVERVSGTLPFGDTSADAWYYDTVYTAYEMGIVKGYSSDIFGIGDNVTRADMCVMVCRMMEIKNISLASKEKSLVFFDGGEIPDYAYDAVQKLQRADIINGDSYGNFNPSDNLTRAEAAVVLWPIFEDIKDIINYSWTKTL